MTEQNITEDEKARLITDAEQGLKNNDYTATKIVYELARKFQEQFPDVSLPIFEQYKDREAQANIYRQTINDLKD